MDFKKIIFCVILIFCSLISSIGISVCNYSKDFNEYEINLPKDSIIEYIKINDNSIVFEKILNEDLAINDNGFLFAQNDTVLYLKQSVIDKIDIKFGNSNEITVNINNNENKIENNVFTYNMNVKDIVSNSINSNTYIEFLILFIIEYFLLKNIQDFYTKKIKSNITYKDIILLMISVFILCFFIYYILYLLLDIYIIIPIILIIIFILYCLRDTSNISIERLYISFVAFLGIIIIFAIPPFNVPDESSHFCKAYKQSILAFKEDDGYIEVPLDIIKSMDKFGSNVHNDENKLIARAYISDFFKECDYSIMNTSLFDYKNVKNANPFPYITSSIVMLVGIKFSMSPLIILLVSRFINLLITVLLCYVAIKIVPCFKKIFLIVCTFPSFLQQSAAINMDYLTNSISILLIAFILYLAYGNIKKINRTQYIILGVLSIILSFCKFGYFPILLLLLLIPKDKFESKKQELITKSMYILFTFIFSFYNNISVSIGNTSYSDIYGIRYLFTNFLDSVIIFFRTLFFRVDQDILVGFYEGLGYYTIYYRPLVKFLLLIIYFIFIFMNSDFNKIIDLKERIIFLVVPILVIGLVYIIAFTQWTTKDQNVIWGIQPRYFLPVIIPLYIGISNMGLKIEIKNPKKMYCYFIAIIYILIFFTIIKFFS